MPPVHHVACHTWAAPIRPPMCAIPRMRNPRFSSDQSCDLASRWGSLVLPIDRWIHTRTLCCLCLPLSMLAGRLFCIRSKNRRDHDSSPPARMAVLLYPCRHRLLVVRIDSVSRACHPIFRSRPWSIVGVIHRLKHPCITRSVPTAGSQRKLYETVLTEPSLSVLYILTGRRISPPPPLISC
ncbi:hypothetical protein HDV57DRAFT_340537 [Trichoderma longibrachiatum]